MSLNCSGSEDRLRNCPYNSFLEDDNCFYIATAVCKGMWKDRHREKWSMNTDFYGVKRVVFILCAHRTHVLKVRVSPL